ncbi:MAG: hypothetical protein WD229_08280, partial [Pirellulales bacterium]
AAEQVFETGNEFHGQTHPTFLPPIAAGDWDNVNIVLILEINDLATTLLPGLGYDQIDFPGAFTHGGSVVIDVSEFNAGPISELKLVGWTSQVGNPSSTAVSFVGGAAMPYEFRADGLYANVPGTLVGDYNGDGVVDAADYVVWRQAYGTQALYDAWRAHFGQSGDSGSNLRSTSSANATVPEPAVGVWMKLAAAAMLFLGRHGSSRVCSNCHHHRDSLTC